MESKELFLEAISKLKGSKCDYLEQLFKYVPDAIVRATSYRKIKKDEFIIHEGEICDTIYIILKGDIVGLDYQKLGRVYYFMDFTQMFIMGDFEIFSESPTYSVSIRASENCEILAIPAALYWQWIQHDENALLLRMKNVMSTLTSESVNHRKYMFMSCKERLMKYLVGSYAYKREKKTGILRLNRTQMELSDRVGFNLRSVQRSIAALEKEKLITMEKGKITVSHEQFVKMSRYLEE